MRSSLALAAVLILGAFATTLGCANVDEDVSSDDGTSEDDFTAASQGLWTLDGTPQAGDIELLQLGSRNYASLVRRSAPAPHAAAPQHQASATTAPAAPAPTPAQPILREAGFGDLWHSGTASAPALSLHAPTSAQAAPSAPTYSVSTSPLGDVLKLTAANGRVLTYRRNYRLYCVPTDRGIEATALLEIGKDPKIVGVNGDGQTFPDEGTYAAKIQTDVLFQLRNYVMLGRSGTKTIRIQFAWNDMSKSMIDGTMAIVGPPSTSASPTPMQCERVTTP